ncbi:MAG: protein kinase [Myxococcales bacterium]|jgi:serine/threonine-protein kinase
MPADTGLPGAGPLPPGYRLGRYEILAKLASGGMAVVYAARAHGVGGFERLVAIKVLHANLAYEEDFIKMFLDEARLAARIRHPNVVPTIDINDSANTGFYLVMDYIEGDHLGALLSGAHRAGERLPVDVALRIVVDALGGLGAAHALTDEHGRPLNLVHRDVSPHNVMVGRDGVARLTDFGVAKAEDRLTHTRDGQVKGKLAYMAPEQASQGHGDARADLFSAGIILWECLTGRRLFRGDNTAATLNKLLHDEVAPPSAVDPELAPLDAVVCRALDRNPERRFQSAEEFAEAVEAVAREVGGLGSSRAVARAVERHAAQRIDRDRKLIAEAKGAIERHSGERGPFDRDGLSEPSLASQLSLSGSSLSYSKLSGVYNSHTSVDARASRPSRRMTPELSLPPPALGQISSSEVPPAPASVHRPPPLWPWLLLALALVGGAGLWLSRGGAPPPPAVPASAIPARPAPQVSAAPAEPVAPAPSREPAPRPADGVEESPPAGVLVLPTPAPTPDPGAATLPQPPGPSATPPTPRRKREVRRPTAPGRRSPPDELIENPYRR